MKPHVARMLTEARKSPKAFSSYKFSMLVDICKANKNDWNLCKRYDMLSRQM